jgi:uncharacterized membrane protein YeaQ/YmgE (transglycosylase-associated protein family)
MEFIAGFAVWIVFGLIGAFAVRLFYSAEGTVSGLTFVFGFFGALIGGMLGTSPYIFHDPTPMRVGALIGALVGAFFFTFMYHFIARKAV